MNRQKPTLLIYVVATTLFSVIPIDPISGQSAENLKQRFLEEALGQWEEYCSFAERLQGKVTELRKRDGKAIAYGFGEHKHNSTCKLFRSQSLLEGATGEVTAYNSMYAFSLRRKGESPWVLTGVERLRKGVENRIVINTLQNSGGMRVLVEAPHNTYLGDLVKQATFRVLSATPARRGDIELVQIEFDNTHPTNEKPFCAIQGGKMLLDSNRSWYLHSGIFRCKFSDDDATVKIETEIRDLQTKYPVPHRWVQSIDLQRDGNRMAVMSTSDFDVQEPSSLPSDDEFTLSAFGLREPFGVAKRPIPWYRWGALAGFLCLGVAALFRWLAHRRAKNQAAP